MKKSDLQIALHHQKKYAKDIARIEKQNQKLIAKQNQKAITQKLKQEKQSENLGLQMIKEKQIDNSQSGF